MELERFVFSRTSRLMNVPTAYRVPASTDQKTVQSKQGRHPNTLSVLLKMEKVGEIEVVDVGDNAESGVISQREGESLVDENAEIFDTILLGETIETAKGKLEVFKDQGSDTCGVFKSFFHFFSVNQTPHCPEFVEWCAYKFSATKGVIMNRSKSKILSYFQAHIIHKTLHILDEFVHISQKYQEENIVQFFRESTVENRDAFLKSCSKPNDEVINLSYPIDLNQFNEES